MVGLDVSSPWKFGHHLTNGSLSANFGPKKVSSTKKVLCQAQNLNFQLSLGFYLDTDQILKVWSLLEKRISLRKFWSKKGFQYLQGPKIKIGPKKRYHLGITLKIPETLEFNLGNVIRTRYAAPKFVTDRQTDWQSQILAQVENNFEKLTKKSIFRPFLPFFGQMTIFPKDRALSLLRIFGPLTS